ncbi:AraC family transcriptional regulator [Plantactinospora sp. WMMB334]|uniref:AraC family transcriptional regulator n=1 Tax=Plantactinospora sp. WMMB334 TaxID=3404119 RepID=UPI003B93956A
MRAPSDAMIAAWRPPVAGIIEVFHAEYAKHEYPVHTHDAWTLLIVDGGAVHYQLDHREHTAFGATITLLPPNLPHDGRVAAPGGLRKRVLYLDQTLLHDTMVGPAVDAPELCDPLLRTRVGQLHDLLAQGGDDLEAHCRLVLIGERLRAHLSGGSVEPPVRRERRLARRLRELLDEHTAEGIQLDHAAELLQAHPVHLIRIFRREYGLPPHRYLTGRRVEHARRLLLAGIPPADVATAAGFYDQSHLCRHFKQLVGVSPAYFARLSHGITRPHGDRTRPAD